MHLVFLNQYYPPDVAPTGVMLEAVVERLVRDGHEVTVLCASGGYAGRGQRADSSERRAQCKKDAAIAPCSALHASCSCPRIIRLRASRFGRGTFIGKLLDYASYYVGVAWKLMTMHPKPDRIVALTTPPLLSVLARLFSKFRGADHAHWVMDLYPDVMAAHGMLKEGNPLYQILECLARWGFGGRRCAALLTLGPDMAERCERLVGALSIERPTSNIEHRREEVAEESPNNPQSAIVNRQSSISPTSSNSQPSTPNPQLSSVQWVPLWGTGGAERGGGEHRTVQFKDDSGESAPNAQPPAAESISSISTSTLNAQLPTASTALRLKRGWGNEELIVMYSGNMGLGHRFGEILAAAERMNMDHGALNIEHPTSDIELRSEEVAEPNSDNSPRKMNDSRDEFRGPEMPANSSNPQPSTLNSQLIPIRFVFFGGGRRRLEVEAFVRDHPGCAVDVHDYAAAEELAAHLQSADVHLASLDEAWTGTMVPSKLQGIFAAGRPVIFIGSGASSIGRWVVESGGGWVVREGDVGGLLAALAEARDPAARLTRGRAALEYAATHFDRGTNVARVASIVAQQRK